MYDKIILQNSHHRIKSSTISQRLGNSRRGENFPFSKNQDENNWSNSYIPNIKSVRSKTNSYRRFNGLITDLAIPSHPTQHWGEKPGSSWRDCKLETNIWNGYFGKDRASKEWWRRSVEEKVRGEEAIYSTIRTRWVDIIQKI